MKRIYKILIAVAAVLVVGFAGFLIYASDYRTLEEEYYSLFDKPDVYTSDGLVHFDAESNSGIVFYPGGRVDYLAYAPLCEKLQERGINVFLVDMPFNMANFGIGKASDIMQDYEHITNWYVAGHSLGGVAASMYADGNDEKINGLILLGIYASTDYDLQNTITINGSNDLRVGDGVDYTTNVHIIEGGNHAGFGNYGPNDGDGVATVSSEDQQNQAADLIDLFIRERNK